MPWNLPPPPPPPPPPSDVVNAGEQIVNAVVDVTTQVVDEAQNKAHAHDNPLARSIVETMVTVTIACVDVATSVVRGFNAGTEAAVVGTIVGAETGVFIVARVVEPEVFIMGQVAAVAISTLIVAISVAGAAGGSSVGIMTLVARIAAQTARYAAQVALREAAQEALGGAQRGVGAIKSQMGSLGAEINRLMIEIAKLQEAERQELQEAVRLGSEVNRGVSKALQSLVNGLQLVIRAGGPQQVLPSEEHAAKAAGHMRQLQFVVSRLIPVVQRQCASNPIATQAAGSLQRLNGHFQMTGATLLRAREAAQRLKMQKVMNLTPGFKPPIGGGFRSY
jgi:hypothetical protein